MINYLEIAGLATILMLWGFIYYASMIQAWTKMHWLIRIPAAVPMLPFAVLDATFNIFVGSILFVELPFVNGVTFSARLCHWYEQGGSGWRYEQARWWAEILNEISPNHIN